MTSRERILAAINHKQPDRIPVDLCSTGSSGISVVAYQNLIKYIGKEHLKTYAYDVIQGLVQPEMEFLDYFGVDVVDIGRHFNTEESYWKELELIKGHKALYPHWLQTQTLEDGSVGIIGETGEIIGRMPLGATFFDQTIFPFLDGYPDNYDNLGNEMKRVIWGGVGFTPWDWSGRSDFWKMLRQKTIELRNSTDKTLLIGVGCNLFEWGTFLRRMDNFLMDLYLEPENVHNLLDKLMERHMETLERTCEAIGDVADIIKFGDDLGTNKGPFIPVEIYDEFFKPRHKQMCDYVKANSSMHTMLHSCGGIYDLIPGLIEAGFEILNPVQINAENMEPERLKREFGSSITFWGGGCDTKSVLNTGTKHEIKEHVKSNINVFNKSGGFVFNTVHNIMSDIKPESIVAMFEAVNELNG